MLSHAASLPSGILGIGPPFGQSQWPQEKVSVYVGAHVGPRPRPPAHSGGSWTGRRRPRKRRSSGRRSADRLLGHPPNSHPFLLLRAQTPPEPRLLWSSSVSSSWSAKQASSRHALSVVLSASLLHRNKSADLPLRGCNLLRQRSHLLLERGHTFLDEGVLQPVHMRVSAHGQKGDATCDGCEMGNRESIA